MLWSRTISIRSERGPDRGCRSGRGHGEDIRPVVGERRAITLVKIVRIYMRQRMVLVVAGCGCLVARVCGRCASFGCVERMSRRGMSTRIEGFGEAVRRIVDGYGDGDARTDARRRVFWGVPMTRIRGRVHDGLLGSGQDLGIRSGWSGVVTGRGTTVSPGSGGHRFYSMAMRYEREARVHGNAG